jgi:hypothetical protein
MKMSKSKGTFSLYRRSAAEEAHASLNASGAPVAQTAISIAVDTDYIGTLPPGTTHANAGIYMVDNRVQNGSTNEGQLELSTHCPVGNLISFTAVPVNAESANPGTIEITGFNVSQGNVFTAAGQPRPFTPPPGVDEGAFWIGQAMQGGSQTYQVQIKVTIGQLQPVSYYISWDPFITAQ